MTNVILHTSKDDITVKMHDDMLITTGNFMKFVRKLSTTGRSFTGSSTGS